MDLNLKNKVALVTGSTKGIGHAIAKQLHAEGCHVVLNGRNEVTVKEACRSLGNSVVGFAADVSKKAESLALIDFVEMTYGRLDVLVCNVGSGASVKPGEENEEEWLRVFRVNFLSATNIIEAGREALAKSKGSIVCISSICGNEVLPGAPLTYTIAKTALNTYVKGVMRPLAEQGIRINAVSPGNIMFHGSTWEKRHAQNKEGVQKMLERDVALKRFGKPEEIADCVAFLVSERSSFITGSVHVVDGGQIRS